MNPGAIFSLIYMTLQPMKPEFGGRFAVNVTLSGNYDLTIQNVTTTDSGFYKCTTDFGTGSVRIITNLTVAGMHVRFKTAVNVLLHCLFRVVDLNCVYKYPWGLLSRGGARDATAEWGVQVEGGC